MTIQAFFREVVTPGPSDFSPGCTAADLIWCRHNTVPPSQFFSWKPSLNSRRESRTAEDLLERNGGGGGGGGGDTGIFGETFHTPGGSPRFPSEGRRDSRKAILLKLTYLNLFLALVLITVGAAGPQYPGHSGTTDNPISNWVSIERDRKLIRALDKEQHEEPRTPVCPSMLFFSNNTLE